MFILIEKILIIKKIELVRKKEFIISNFDLNKKVFVVFITIFANFNIDFYYFQ